MITLLFAYILLNTSAVGVVFIWLHTDAFVEYAQVFKLTRFWHVQEFLDATENDPGKSYPDFVQERYSTFWTRLFRCPKCLLTWTSLYISMTMTLYGKAPWLMILVLTPATLYCSLYLYFSLVKLMKHE